MKTAEELLLAELGLPKMLKHRLILHGSKIVELMELYAAQISTEKKMIKGGKINGNER